MVWSKPFKSFDEQIEYLINTYNLTINNVEEAKRILSKIPYYDLVNGYKDSFMINGKYMNTSIEDLYHFLLFDRSIQGVLFKYSVYVENRFKNLLAYHMAQDFGVDIPLYINSNNFKNQFKFVEIENKVSDLLNSKNLDDPTKHYKQNHNHIPPWILFKNITFNDAIDIYSNLITPTKQKVCDQLVDSVQLGNYALDFSSNALIVIRKFRNKIAHNLKCVNYRLDRNKIILKHLYPLFGGSLIQKRDMVEKRGMDDLFAMILSLFSLLNDKELSVYFYIDFLVQINLYNDFFKNPNLWKEYSKATNLPLDLEDRMKKYLFKKPQQT